MVAAFVLAAVAPARPLAGQVTSPSPTLTPAQALARAVYKELIETNTVDSVGSTTKAAEAVAARFRAAGFPAADVHLLIPPGHPDKGTLIVRYRGRGQGTPLLLLAHLACPVQLNPVSTAFFRGTAALEVPVIAAAMRAVVADQRDSAAIARLSPIPRYNSMLRTTCVATRLSGGHAYNALPQTATANVNCRIVPTQTPEEVKATIAQALGDTGIHITETIRIREKTGAAPSPLTADLMQPVTEITHALYGADVAVIPVMSTGATDGRFLRAAGIPTYGVSGIFSDPADARAHGRDERLLVRSFYDGQAFLHRLVRRLTGGKPAA
ncbi:MAG: hypothetical protein NVS9B3_04180 [Gemmatimonadaceae bacterium]